MSIPRGTYTADKSVMLSVIREGYQGMGLPAADVDRILNWLGRALPSPVKVVIDPPEKNVEQAQA